MMTKIIKNPIVPVFYAADENYFPFLGVALTSLQAFASPAREYRIHVLVAGELGKSAEKLKAMQTENVKIEFHQVGEKIELIKKSLHCRDYYTQAIFYRLFIPELFPQYEKAIYLDCDTVLCTDIAELYDTELGANALGAVADQAVAETPAFCAYTQNALGISPEQYFNSGVLLMNLKKLRASGFCKTLCDVLSSYKFTVAPDQDCLNLICHGATLYLDGAWNAMPSAQNQVSEPKLVHYNLSWKPWHYDDVVFGELFWGYAEKSPFLEEVKARRAAFTPEMAENDRASGERLIALAQSEADSPYNYYKTREQKERITGDAYGFFGNFAKAFGNI